MLRVVLEPTQASSQELTGQFSGMLHNDRRYSDSMHLAMVGIFIPWILADITPELPLHHHPHLGDPRAPHLPPHNCMCKSVLHKENCCVLALYRCICLWMHIRITWGTWPTRQLPAWIPLSTMISGNFVKRLLEVMQVRDEGMKHRKEEHSYERNTEVEWRSFVTDSDSFPLHHFPACNHRLIFVIP